MTPAVPPCLSFTEGPTCSRLRVDGVSAVNRPGYSQSGITDAASRASSIRCRAPALHFVAGSLGPRTSLLLPFVGSYGGNILAS